MGSKLLHKISTLADRRRALYARAAQRPLFYEERKELAQIEQKLEDLWSRRRIEGCDGPFCCGRPWR